MIKLSPYRLDDGFVESYIKDKFSKIKNVILSDPGKKVAFRKLFRQAFVGRVINERFFDDILSMNLTDVIYKYDSVRDYFELAFFTSLDIKNICSRRTQESRDKRNSYYVRFKARYSEAEDIKEAYTKTYKCQDFENYIVACNEHFSEFQKFIQNEFLNGTKYSGKLKRYGVIADIFDYDKMVHAEEKCEVVKNLDILACPYCNRAFVSNFADTWGENKKRTSADLDHFYPKKYFALFSLSLYNFVPSCKVCNSLFKGSKNMDILYPYGDSYEDIAKFTLVDDSLKIQSAGAVYGWRNGQKLDLIVKNGINSDKIEREIRLFRIREVYQVHNDYAERLLFKKNVLGERVKKEIIDTINRNTFKEKLKGNEFDKLFYGVDKNDIETERKNTPLSKLICDIMEWE